MHATEETNTGVGPVGDSVKVKVLLTPEAVAVRTAFCVVETLAAFAVNPMLDWPPGMVTADGAVKFELLLLSATAKPLLEALPFKATVQAAEPGVAMFDGVQESELRASVAVLFTAMVPPVPVAATLDPSPAAAVGTANCTATEVSVGLEAMLKVTFATVPDAIALSFKPDTTHTVLPDAPLQDTVLDAAAAADPAATVMPLISAAE